MRRITTRSNSKVREGNLHLYPGKPLPLGASLIRGGVQFSIFSRHADRVWLQLYRTEDEHQPTLEICLSPEHNKTGDYWHIAVEGLKPGQCYLYRMDGPEGAGLCFNPDNTLIDPYARAVRGSKPRCVVSPDNFDWQGDAPLKYPLSETIIYETHLRGLTQHPSAARHGVTHPGTFRGVMEMIPYLVELGVTALELMPVQEFDETEYSFRSNPFSAEPLVNYWGYSTLAFFAPKAAYSSSADQVHEFKEMVRALHQHKIELILDVVFNHSGEGDFRGRAYSFRGIDNPIYYMLDRDSNFYRNYSGCGNTLNCNHPVVRRLVMDALHYWVQEMHVDGFRFDLAPILGRGEDGQFMEAASLLNEIAEDPLLRDSKIIAEPWDAGGEYRLGRFPGRWAEWNDRYRDDVRMFWRGDSHKSAALAARLTASEDIYGRQGQGQGRGDCFFPSINYISAHDGFTSNDLVSYNEKHNEENGEENRDGNNHEFSFNFGVEGETEDVEVNGLRSRMVKNFLATILLSYGTPMILGGDEMRRSQLGNNNAYCQDNGTSWYNHDLLDKYADIHRFLCRMIAFRKGQPALHCEPAKITWYSEDGSAASWDRPENILSLKIDARPSAGNDLCLLFNATPQDCNFVLPSARPGHRWHRVADTALPEADSSDSGEGRTGYQLPGQSLAVFIAHPPT